MKAFIRFWQQPSTTSWDNKVLPLWESCLWDYFYPAIWLYRKVRSLRK